MNAGDFPYMREFCSGSFSANSGGRLDENTPVDKFGTKEEWEYAEHWLQFYCHGLLQATQNQDDPQDDESVLEEAALGIAFHLGLLADEGQAIVGQFAQEEHGNPFYKDAPPTDDLVRAPPWVILDRYY